MSGPRGEWFMLVYRSAIFRAPVTLGRCLCGDEEHSASSNSISILRTCGALFARSFKSSTFSRNSGRGVLARGSYRTHDTVLFRMGRGLRFNLEPLATLFRAFVISSGYRGFASVLQNSPSRVSDVLQILSPAFVASQAVAVLKRSWRALQCPTKVLKDLTK